MIWNTHPHSNELEKPSMPNDRYHEDCLRRMLNKEFYEQLQKIGYRKTQKHLTLPK